MAAVELNMVHDMKPDSYTMPILRRSDFKFVMPPCGANPRLRGRTYHAKGSQAPMSDNYCLRRRASVEGEGAGLPIADTG